MFRYAWILGEWRAGLARMCCKIILNGLRMVIGCSVENESRNDSARCISWHLALCCCCRHNVSLQINASDNAVNLQKTFYSVNGSVVPCLRHKHDPLSVRLIA